MGSTLENDVIVSLKRIDDEDAARLVSAQALSELEEAILAIAPAPVRRRPGRRTLPRGTRRPLFALGVAAALAMIALAASGALSGSGPAEVPPADAAILQSSFRALAHPGTIVLESYRGISRLTPKPPATPATQRWSAREVIETPFDKGAQNELDLEVPAVTNGVEIGEVNGNNELYDPSNDTVYISSQFGSDITRGPRPGTYVYTLPRDFYPAGTSGPMPPPLAIAAVQAGALRDGTAHVLLLPDNGHRGAANAVHLKVTSLDRTPVEVTQIRAQLEAGRFKVSGMTSIDGRDSIKLIGVRGNPIKEYDVAPGTYAPIREVVRTPGDLTIVTYSEYRVLPDTDANAQLLNLAKRHPNARVDRDRADYKAAARRLLNGG
jgi:hypothetical protein